MHLTTSSLSGENSRLGHWPASRGSRGKEDGGRRTDASRLIGLAWPRAPCTCHLGRHRRLLNGGPEWWSQDNAVKATAAARNRCRGNTLNLGD